MIANIQNVTVVDSQSAWNGRQVDILIKNGKISAINPEHWPTEIDETFSGDSLYISPSWTDLRVFSGEPGEEFREDWQSLSNTIAAGGFGRALLMPNTSPVIQSKADIKAILGHNQTQIAELLPAAAVTKDCDNENLNEMMDAFHSGARAFTDGEIPIWNSDILLKSLQYLQVFDGLLINFPEDHKLGLFAHMNEGKVSTSLGLKGVPHLAEEIMIQRDIELLKYAGGKIHFSGISSAKSVDLIKKAKEDGLQVSADVCIRNLIYTEEDLRSYDSNFKVKPVLRTADDREALIKGINDGTIDAICSNHQPQDNDHKDIEFDLAAYGAIGAQLVFPLYSKHLQNEIPLEKFIQAITFGPNKILKLEQSKIEQGQTVDFTLFSTKSAFKFDQASNKSLSYNCPELNTTFEASAVALLRGKKVFNITQ